MENETRRAALPQFATRTVRATVVSGPNAGAIATGAEDRLTIGSAESNDLVLGDPLVSRYHAEISATPSGLHVRDVGSTNGTIANGLRIESAIVPPGTELVLGSTTVRIDDGSKAIVALHEHEELGGLIGQSLPMRRAMAHLAKIAPTAASVLLVGESGTGKEVAARALHEGSGRGEGPFVVVDCASLVPNLAASELFGHERGAFTGADRMHVGAFERANGGTLFLDEIGELPPDMQPNLLGALERRRFRRVGGKEDISIDVRVVSATHRDLRADVNAGRFRLDLYYRVAVVVIELPPLRARRGDVKLLAAHFLREAGDPRAIDDALPADFFASLETHAFPGNVRELKNLVEAALATGESPALDAIAPSSASPLLDRVLDASYGAARDAILAEFERRYLAHLLARCNDNVSQAARVAMMDRSHLTSLLRRHKLRQPK
jgi:DNA-binding NtrC family response regulator